MYILRYLCIAKNYDKCMNIIERDIYHLDVDGPSNHLVRINQRSQTIRPHGVQVNQEADNKMVIVVPAGLLALQTHITFQVTSDIEVQRKFMMHILQLKCKILIEVIKHYTCVLGYIFCNS